MNKEESKNAILKCIQTVIQLNVFLCLVKKTIKNVFLKVSVYDQSLFKAIFLAIFI